MAISTMVSRKVPENVWWDPALACRGWEVGKIAYHCLVVSVAALPNTSPVTLVFFSSWGIATVNFVAILAVFTVAPSIELQCHFVVMTMAIAGRSRASPGTLFWVRSAIKGAAQEAVRLF